MVVSLVPLPIHPIYILEGFSYLEDFTAKYESSASNPWGGNCVYSAPYNELICSAAFLIVAVDAMIFASTSSNENILLNPAS